MDPQRKIQWYQDKLKQFKENFDYCKCFDYLNYLPSTSNQFQSLKTLIFDYFNNITNDILTKTVDSYMVNLQTQKTSLIFLKKLFIEEAKKIKKEITQALKIPQRIDSSYQRIKQQIDLLPQTYQKIDEISAGCLKKIRKTISRSLNVENFQVEEEKEQICKSSFLGDSDQVQSAFTLAHSLAKSLKENIKNCNKIQQELLPNYENLIEQIQVQSKEIIDQKTKVLFENKLDRVLSKKIGVYKNISQLKDQYDKYLIKLSKLKKDLSTKKHKKYFDQISELKKKFRDYQEVVIQNKMKNNNTTIEVTNNSSIFKKKIMDLIDAVVIIDQPYIEQEFKPSNFLIQPIKGTNRFFVYDIDKKKRVEHQLMDNYQFPQYSMGTVHLSKSLILAGGRSYPHCFKEVYRIFENGQYEFLPDLRTFKAGMGLAALRDGQIIACLGGQNVIEGNINKAEILVKFKKWRDLPNLRGKRLEGRAVVGIDPGFIFTFGGRPFDSDNSIMGINLENQGSKWFVYQEIAFKRRFYDGVAYLKKQNRIVVFGSSQGERCHQIKLNAKKCELQLVHRSSKTFPFNTQSFISWKVYDGNLYSFDIGRENLFKYNILEHEWVMQDKD